METVHLDVFEGPLDLLLHLIKKEDIDINDIPISKLLSEYLQYLELAKELNVDLAGEFLEMAAELIYIKSKMLLPEAVVEEDEGPDPRADLVARLLEYQKYKLAATTLLHKPILNRDVFKCLPVESDGDLTQELSIDVDLNVLLNAVQEILKRAPKEQVHEIRGKILGVAERVIQLVDRLKGREQTAFEDLFDAGSTRIDIVVTFLAVLEMSKQGLLRIVQERVLDKIVVLPLMTEVSAELVEKIQMQGDEYGTQENS